MLARGGNILSRTEQNVVYMLEVCMEGNCWFIPGWPASLPPNIYPCYTTWRFHANRRWL